MRQYLLAAYAMLMRDHPEPGKVEQALDERFPHELTEAERRMAEARRIADANRAAVAALSQTTKLATPGP